MTARRTWILVVGIAFVASTAALALPVTLAYDPWTWLVWGREVVRGDLDTTGGPSWKPLPVFVTAPLSALGALAPAVWLVIARTAGLMALAGAFQLGRRLAGAAAGALAALLLVLTPDGGPRFVRLVLEGHTAPWTAALSLWAVERTLAGRPRTAVALLSVLAWDRPEAWPFLLAYVVWCRRARHLSTAAAAAVLLSVPVLWFGGDWIGSGSPFHGADSAQVYADEAGRVGIALEHVIKVVLAPAWAIALIALVRGRRTRDDPVPAMVGLALGWVGLVVGMSALLGYAALTRFLLPAAALLCVSAAVAMTRASRTSGVAVVACVLLIAPFAAQRVQAIGRLYDDMADRGRADRELADVIDAAGGIDELRRCPPLTIDTSDVPRAALAWRADLPAREVERARAPYGGTIVAQRHAAVGRALAASDTASLQASSGRWAIYLVGC